MIGFNFKKYKICEKCEMECIGSICEDKKSYILYFINMNYELMENMFKFEIKGKGLHNFIRFAEIIYMTNKLYEKGDEENDKGRQVREHI